VESPFSTERIRAAYDLAAPDYVAAFADDLARLPVDRRMLDTAGQASKSGMLLDLGCGAGSAGSYLTGNGARVVGVDLSLGMLKSIDSARRFPSCQGDMRRLPFNDGSFTAVVAFYSIHHVPRAELGAVLDEAARVLQPEGTLLIATHLGQGEVYSDEFLGRRIATTGGSLYAATEIVGAVEAKGFRVDASETRDPLAHERQSQRLYLLVRRAA
jgi:ubiquinone/menaquinone biosynthesis C-methylase UbiE